MEFLVKSILIVLGVLVAGIPTWSILLVKHFAQPEGFWQNIVLFGFGFYVMGGIQLFLVFCLIFWIMFVALEL